MKRSIFALMFCCLAATTFAQPPATPRGARGPAPQPVPLFFHETWKDFDGNVPLTQSFVVNPDLQLNMYGAGTEDFHVTNEGKVPHIWTGLCASSCVLTLSHKENLVDLTGKARIRWYRRLPDFTRSARFSSWRTEPG